MAAGPAQAKSCKGGSPTSVKLDGVVKNKAVYTLESLQRFRLDPAKDYTPTTVTVTYNSSQGKVTATYTGIPLIDLLTVAKVKVKTTQKNDILRKYVVAHASDCYEAVVALGEILPNYEAKKVLVAYADGNGQPLPASDGVARLVMPGDTAGGRNVFHLSKLTVRSAPN
jgi:DMSO/TMAO reductase YedYZ molybdopterin-dependent catalytic subunit